MKHEEIFILLPPDIVSSINVDILKKISKGLNVIAANKKKKIRESPQEKEQIANCKQEIDKCFKENSSLLYQTDKTITLRISDRSFSRKKFSIEIPNSSEDDKIYSFGFLEKEKKVTTMSQMTFKNLVWNSACFTQDCYLVDGEERSGKFRILLCMVRENGSVEWYMSMNIFSVEGPEKKKRKKDEMIEDVSNSKDEETRSRNGKSKKLKKDIAIQVNEEDLAIQVNEPTPSSTDADALFTESLPVASDTTFVNPLVNTLSEEKQLPEHPVVSYCDSLLGMQQQQMVPSSENTFDDFFGDDFFDAEEKVVEMRQQLDLNSPDTSYEFQNNKLMMEEEEDEPQFLEPSLDVK